MGIVSKPSKTLEKTRLFLQFTLRTPWQLSRRQVREGLTSREKEQATKGCSCPPRCESPPNNYKDLQGWPLIFRCLRWVPAAWWGKLSAGGDMWCSRGVCALRNAPQNPCPILQRQRHPTDPPCLANNKIITFWL